MRKSYSKEDLRKLLREFTTLTGSNVSMERAINAIIEDEFERKDVDENDNTQCHNVSGGCLSCD